jgi:hypothetical protein
MRANYFYCDRCKKLFNTEGSEHIEPRFFLYENVENGVDGGLEQKDICPDCADDLERWFSSCNTVRGGDDEDGTEDSEVP